MGFSFTLFEQDFQEFLRMLGSQEAFEVWLTFGFVLSLILVPLTFCDRRDLTAGLVYATSLAACTTTLMAVSFQDFPIWGSTLFQFFVVGGVALMAAIRWFYANWGNDIQVKTISNEGESDDGRKK